MGQLLHFSTPKCFFNLLNEETDICYTHEKHYVRTNLYSICSYKHVLDLLGYYYIWKKADKEHTAMIAPQSSSYGLCTSGLEHPHLTHLDPKGKNDAWGSEYGLSREDKVRD